MKFLSLFLLISAVCFAGPQRGVKQSASFLYDFNVSGGASTTHSLTALGNSLPVSAVVTDMVVQVLEPLTSSGSATFTIGSTADPDGWVPSTAYTTAVNNYTKNAGQLLSPSLWDNTNDVISPYLIDASNKKDVNISIGGADLTGGKIYVWFEFVVPARY